MPVSFNKFLDFSEQLIRGVHDWDAHTFKVALSNVAPTNTDTSLAPAGAHAAPTAANGYAAGGVATTITLSESTGTTTVQGTQVSWTASGGQLGPFRYIILYNDTATSPADALIGWWDYGSSITLNDTETFTFQFNSASPGTIMTLA